MIELNIVCDRAAADWGVGDPMSHYRSVAVDDDGSVLARNELDGCYSRHHELTDAQVAEAQRLAGLVRSGTHYAAGGFVRPKR